MRRETFAAVGITSALLLSGCAAETQVDSNQRVSSSQNRAALPSAIEAELAANILQFKTEDSSQHPEYGSAVRVALGNKAIILTAAHMLGGATKDCSQETLYASNGDGTTTQYTPTLQSPVPRSSNYEWDNMNRVDAAAIIPDVTTGADALAITSKEPKVGSTLIMANFQAFPDGTSRDVAAYDAARLPAIYSGIVVGYFKKKLVVATGHGESYGATSDDTQRSASSGGAAIIDNPTSPDNARLAGLTISTLNDTKTAAQIEQMYGYQPPEGTYTVGFVEPITQSVANRLDHQAEQMPACT
ncbi:MAG: hypothetical protein ACQR33_02330 [Candidatus Saccharibacteria bacterium]